MVFSPLTHTKHFTFERCIRQEYPTVNIKQGGGYGDNTKAPLFRGSLCVAFFFERVYRNQKLVALIRGSLTLPPLSPKSKGGFICL